MARLASLVSFIVVLVDVAWCQQWTNPENQLVVDKLVNYPPRKHVRPVDNPTDTIHVYMNYTLTRLVAFDEENMMATMQGWRAESWNDKFLAWNPTDYGNVYSMRVSSDAIWRPDFRDYNAVKEETAQDEVVSVAFNDGTVVNMPPTMHRISCHWQTGNDHMCETGDVHCKLVLGSWTFTKAEVELHIDTPLLEADELHDPEDPDWHMVDLDWYQCHPRWNLYNARAQLENMVYDDFEDFGEYPQMKIHFCLHDSRHYPGYERTDCFNE